MEQVSLRDIIMDEQMYEQMLLKVLSREKMFFEQTMMWNKKNSFRQKAV